VAAAATASIAHLKASGAERAAQRAAVAATKAALTKSGLPLLPSDTHIVPVMVEVGSYIYDRAWFVQHNLWVTRYDPDEKFAAGDYMYQSADLQGLPQYLTDDAPLEDTDVVLWYTLGAHHVVRPEDWPVMPCAYTGFHLKPIGFFDGNPALDIPPSPPASRTTMFGRQRRVGAEGGQDALES
jgi:hypothetical protein